MLYTVFQYLLLRTLALSFKKHSNSLCGFRKFFYNSWRLSLVCDYEKIFYKILPAPVMYSYDNNGM